MGARFYNAPRLRRRGISLRRHRAKRASKLCVSTGFVLLTDAMDGFAQQHPRASKWAVCRAFDPNNPLTWNNAAPAEEEELPTLSQDELNALLGVRPLAYRRSCLTRDRTRTSPYVVGQPMY